jgi:hypothetical protein
MRSEGDMRGIPRDTVNVKLISVAFEPGKAKPRER